MRVVLCFIVIAVVSSVYCGETSDNIIPSDELGCVCPRNYDPVCASNNKTYNNKCLFECAKEFYRKSFELKIQKSGRCEEVYE